MLPAIRTDFDELVMPLLGLAETLLEKEVSSARSARGLPPVAYSRWSMSRPLSRSRPTR
jgi:hypothetical protein